ncbi:YqcI/YcgG family protein [Gallibacterium anatis]|uniref:YqcI/YcgG family protein n=1 Tax=Gallibacterium anatis TaxID=750 RepID=A0A930UWG9_9PAST|nr:YqcI/YcgG family protein [Gallibacterium anatis]
MKIFRESALQYLIDHDSESWEQCEIKRSNKRIFGSMQFRNIQLFINVSHHNNVNRLSRNLCDTLVFVINPRRFDILQEMIPKAYLLEIELENIDQYDKIKQKSNFRALFKWRLRVATIFSPR